VPEKKKTQDRGTTYQKKITYRTKRFKDLHISIVFKAFLVQELEIIPK